MEILVTNQSKLQIDLDNLKRLAKYVLSDEKAAAESEVSVALVDPDKIQELNLRYRHIDRPTDVLSFDLSDDGKISGEVVISPQVAMENAIGDADEGADEIESLLIHGLQHLLGYTHDHEEDAEVMFDRHERLRQAFSADRGKA